MFRGKRVVRGRLVHPNMRVGFPILQGYEMPVILRTRHSFGTFLAQRGTPVTVIQTLMGHKSVSTTERYMSTRADIAQSWVEHAFDTRN